MPETETVHPLLSLQNITKIFGDLVANGNVNLDLHAGEIVALLGENGAGKTTLMNILFGHYVADEGRVMVRTSSGTLVDLEPGAPQAALEAGIGMVHQHFTLAENLTGLENIVLGTESLFARKFSRSKARAKLQELMQSSGLEVDLDLRVSKLAVGERQRVEILKALYRDARILVLDEPTAVLTPQESDSLFNTLKLLAAKGMAIIFISHKMAEVLGASDRVAVLRGGRIVADLPTSQCDRHKLAELMVGHAVQMAEREPGNPGEEILVFKGVSAGEGRELIENVNLSLRKGEIIGLAGVSGNGQSMLAKVLSGLEEPTAGAVTLGSQPLKANAAAAIQSGVARIPEDRHHDGIVGAMSVEENLVLEEIRKPAYQRFGLLRFNEIRKRAQEAIKAYDIRCSGPLAVSRLLSGGNIQKIVLARTLDQEPAIVLAAQPSRGLDVGATADVHRRLQEARDRGAGVLLISEDLDELFQLSDRIAVIHRGHVSEPMASEELDKKQVGLMMAGHSAKGEQAA
ncbi:Xylose import ATP-binding protein XylG [Pseudovibrio axinellae]|uniref:Xylose import ATP-binding protein XylG n=1 Tax=Pseudovibrio axinellae TaxID=989403 RepID=A0A165YX16_9HYPH|nr:ABC transporter ATP-binding protein [Pseudovibrio axinellae]KZL19312.1 Xylose import ATP-binding protein XylG [Pseudovibrio axinellae]SEQ41805.1 nucleoside ABC transporter ATP-binding protein [Pseudovibrio axinellae]